jgi:hypothetical protein
MAAINMRFINRPPGLDHRPASFDHAENKAARRGQNNDSSPDFCRQR